MRDKQFYVSTDVYRAYWLLAKGNKSVSSDPSRDTVQVTPDEIANKVLRKHIEDNYPELFAHQKQVDELEKQLIEQLTTFEPTGATQKIYER